MNNLFFNSPESKILISFKGSNSAVVSWDKIFLLRFLCMDKPAGLAPQNNNPFLLYGKMPWSAAL